MSETMVTRERAKEAAAVLDVGVIRQSIVDDEAAALTIPVRQVRVMLDLVQFAMQTLLADDTAQSLAADVSEDVRVVREALETARRSCSLCRGRGTYESLCPRCVDSTDDHVCEINTFNCNLCIERRGALAALTRIESALAKPSAEPAPSWQPMETAPRDGTWIRITSCRRPLAGDGLIARSERGMWRGRNDVGAYPEGHDWEFWRPLTAAERAEVEPRATAEAEREGLTAYCHVCGSFTFLEQHLPADKQICGDCEEKQKQPAPCLTDEESRALHRWWAGLRTGEDLHIPGEMFYPKQSEYMAISALLARSRPACPHAAKAEELEKELAEARAECERLRELKNVWHKIAVSVGDVADTSKAEIERLRAKMTAAGEELEYIYHNPLSPSPWSIPEIIKVLRRSVVSLRSTATKGEKP